MIEGRYVTKGAPAAAGIDLARCGFVMLQVGLYEHEQLAIKPDAPSADWPEAVRRLVERQVDAWCGRNRDRAVVFAHSYVAERQCVVELYHVDPNELAPAASSQVDGASAAPRVPMPAAPPGCGKCGE